MKENLGAIRAEINSYDIFLNKMTEKSIADLYLPFICHIDRNEIERNLPLTMVEPFLALILNMFLSS